MSVPAEDKSVEETLEAITVEAANRLCKRAGIKRLSKKDITDGVRRVTRDYLQELIRFAIEYINDNKHTIHAIHAVKAISDAFGTEVVAVSTLHKNCGAMSGHTGKRKAEASDSEPQAKKARKFRQGTRALMDIRGAQKTTGTMIPREPFSRIVRRIAKDYKPRRIAKDSKGGEKNLRFGADAILTIQAATEAYLVDLLHKANCLVIYAGKETVESKELDLVRLIREEI